MVRVKRFGLFAIILFLASVAEAAPVITNVYVSASDATTATIVWTTNVGATSQIRYGYDNTLPFSNNASLNLVTSHQMTLTVLQPGPMYYFAVVSADSGGSSSQSSTFQFALCNGTGQAPVAGTVNPFYQGGTYTLTWIPPTGSSGTPTVCGQAIQTSVTGTLNTFGTFSTQVADAYMTRPGPGTWNIHVADLGNLAPITIQAPLSFQTQDISAQLQAAAAAAGLTGCLVNTLTNEAWPPPCSNGTVGSQTVIQVNGTPTAPVSPVNFANSASVHFNLSSNQITATLQGGPYCPEAGCAFTGAISGPNFNGTIEAVDYPDLPTAIAAVSSGGTLHLNSTYLYTATSQVEFASPLTVKCDFGATLQHGSSLTSEAAFNVTANNVHFDGCTLDGNNVPYGAGIGTMEVNPGVTGFSFRHGALINSKNYGIRFDGTVDSVIDDNVLNNPVFFFGGIWGVGQFAEFFGNASQPTINAQVTNNKGSGAVVFQSPGSGGGPTKSLIYQGNQTINGALTIQDVSSGQTQPLINWVVSGNTCTIQDTSSNPVFGCFSLVANTSTCVFADNTMNASGQYVTDSLLEFGSSGCTVSGNTFNAGNDPGDQDYNDVIAYGGNNSFTGNTFHGASARGSFIRLYPQGALQGYPANTGVANVISGGSMVSDSTADPTAFTAISVTCNQTSGVSSKDTKIGGGLSIQGPAHYAFDIEGDLQGAGDCPVTASIGDVIVDGAMNIAEIANATVSWGDTQIYNVTNQSPLLIGTASSRPAVFIAGISAPGDLTPQKNNLLADSTFKLGTTYWTQYHGGTGPLMVLTSGVGPEGEGGWTETGDGTSGPYQTFVYQQVSNLTPSTTYSVSTYVNVTGTPPSVGQIGVGVCSTLVNCQTLTYQTSLYYSGTGGSQVLATSFTTGGSQTSAFFVMTLNTVTNNSGQVITFAEPQFNLGSQVNGFVVTDLGSLTTVNQIPFLVANSPTVGYFPLFSSAGVVSNSPLDYGVTTANVITSTAKIAAPSFLVSGALSTGTTGNTDFSGKIALTGGAGSQNFTGPFANPPNCVLSDPAGNTFHYSVSASAITITAGTGTDVISYLCGATL